MVRCVWGLIVATVLLAGCIPTAEPPGEYSLTYRELWVGGERGFAGYTVSGDQVSVKRRIPDQGRTETYHRTLTREDQERAGQLAEQLLGAEGEEVCSDVPQYHLEIRRGDGTLDDAIFSVCGGDVDERVLELEELLRG